MPLPTPFAALEPLVADWALDTEAARNYKRRTAGMEELRAYYHALLPRMEEIADHLRPLPVNDLPADARHLLNLALMFMEMSLSIENFHSPDVPGGFDPQRFHILPPYVQTAAGVRK